MMVAGRNTVRMRRTFAAGDAVSSFPAIFADQRSPRISGESLLNPIPTLPQAWDPIFSGRVHVPLRFPPFSNPAL